VILATTSPICERRTQDFGTEAAGPERFAELERWCDVAVVQGYVLERVPVLKTTDKALVVDLYDPIFLEDLELNRHWAEADRNGQIANVVRVFREQVDRGDFFLCASEKQRDMWLGFLAATGRLNPANFVRDPSMRALIDVVAFGLPSTPPTHRGPPAMRGAVEGIGDTDQVVLWGGGVYDWLDPLTAVRAVDRVRARHPGVRLFFMGVRHPNPVAEESRALKATRALAEELGLTGRHVFFNETWVPYERRADFLLEADVGISLHDEHVETAYSFRTRILDCIWAGLPIVTTGGDTLADLISREGLGRVVPGSDVQAVAAALDSLLSDPTARSECRRRAAIVAPRYLWPEVLAPLIRFCAAPAPAADRTHPATVPDPAVTTPVGAGRAIVGRATRRLESMARRGIAAYGRGGAKAVAAGAYRAAGRRFHRRA
jgi:glycosyltransferase involved in cell wall biosynthesis